MPGTGIRAAQLVLLLLLLFVVAFGAPAQKLRTPYPIVLVVAGLLLGFVPHIPKRNSAFRQILDQWFGTHGIRPRILGELQDTTLLTMFGQAGAGIFAAPITIEREVRRGYRVAKLGDLDARVMEYDATLADRKIKHPTATAIAEVAKHKLFGSVATPGADL